MEASTRSGEGSRDCYKLTATKEAATRILVCIDWCLIQWGWLACAYDDQLDEQPIGKGAENEYFKSCFVERGVLQFVVSLNSMPDTVLSVVL